MGKCQDCLTKYCASSYKKGKSACNACLDEHKSDLKDGDKCGKQSSGSSCYAKGQDWCKGAPSPPPPAPTPPPPGPTPPPNPLLHQQWLGPSPDTKQTILFKADTTKCVELSGGNTENGTPILINTCNNAKQQQWYYNHFESGYVYYAGDQSKCIDLPGSDVTNGNKLQIWDCLVGPPAPPNQQWWGGGSFQFLSSVNKDKCWPCILRDDL